MIQWARSNAHQPLNQVLLPVAPFVIPLAVGDGELCALITRLLRDRAQAAEQRRVWYVDLGVFPREARTKLATVSAHASEARNEDEATHA